MLDQDAKEALHGAIDYAMHHQRAFTCSVLRHIFQLEALRQVEIKLNRTELPGPADYVYQLDVDLWPIKRGFAGDGFEGNVTAIESVFQGMNSHLPFLLAT